MTPRPVAPAPDPVAPRETGNFSAGRKQPTGGGQAGRGKFVDHDQAAMGPGRADMDVDDPSSLMRSTRRDVGTDTYFVVRAEDRDEEGRYLVGVESGPFDTLEAARASLRMAPLNYSPVGMSSELFLLPHDISAWLADDVAARMTDESCRLIIREEDRLRAVAQFGVWTLDFGKVQTALADGKLAAFASGGKAEPMGGTEVGGQGLIGAHGFEQNDAILGFIRGVDAFDALRGAGDVGAVAAQRYMAGMSQFGGTPRGGVGRPSGLQGVSHTSTGGGQGDNSQQDTLNKQHHPQQRHQQAQPNSQRIEVDENGFTKDGVPYVDARVLGASKSSSSKVVQIERGLKYKQDEDVSEVYHTLRGHVMDGGAEKSRLTPSKRPLPAKDTQFQLATEQNPYHVLALRCPKDVQNCDFAVIMDDRGYVYARAEERDRVGEEAGTSAAPPQPKGADVPGFELLMRFPTLVDEAAAQSVYKDGVLFVIATPRLAHNVVNVKVELEQGVQPEGRQGSASKDADMGVCDEGQQAPPLNRD